ncbi:hypothetical protein C2S53_009935 [Perilla frutescens var. hirtella]|uniref:Uncharacterized protein n=1 Tax=Perilla frutescens var. hirtella TaxID=608512 RepID=A0AAD4J1D2_PERFH|nr:hypothetical protein C2S53_009935 [Perilla frutescens var. hirtella]
MATNSHGYKESLIGFESWLERGTANSHVTPANPGSTNRRQPICTNWGEHETVEANWLETERLAPTQCQRPPACYSSLSVNNASNWHAGMTTNSHVYKENLMGFESWLKKGTANSNVFGKDSSTYDKFSINDPDQWTKISFGNLLRAMGKKAAMENALTHDSFAKSSASSPCFQPQFEDPLARTGFAADPSTISAPYFHSQVEGSQFEMSSGNSSLQDHRNMLGANFDAEMGMPTNTATDRSSTSARHFLDLNSPPKAITDATLRKSTPYQFEPITPEKTNRGEYQQKPAMKHSSIDEAPTGEKNEISRDEVMQLHEKKEKFHLVSDQLSEVTSTQLQENHKPDKGGTEEADFKTPQQKTRRKQHFATETKKGIMYNSLEAYLSVFTQNADISTPGLHFPAIYKKKRTEKVYSTVTSSMQITAYSGNGVKLERHTLRNSCKNLLTSPTNQGSYGVQSQDTNLLTKHATDGTHNGRQVFEDLLALGPTQRIKRRRSKGPTRQRNLASLLESCKQWPNSPGRATISRTEQNIEILNEPLTCIEALVADTRSTMATKKRSKRSMLINSTVQNLYNHQNIAGTSMGPPLALTWKSMSPVDSITDKLNQLDLNAESRSSEEKYNAFMSYHNYYKERYALVPFQSSGAVVPFDASFDQVRRRKPRPKVDLDDETTRVWKLLLENINSEGIDGTNVDNTKWWEEERRVFIGRADSFIARMHLVQGDRRFSPWKGSVVDSVVDVFLTQNVSDHLSSSAFMSLAARFPVNPMIHSAALHDERSGGEINEPEVCVLESDGDGTFVLTKEILNDTVCGEDTKTLQEFEDDSNREVNSMRPSQNASGNESILEDELRGQSTDTSLGPVISCEIIANRSVSSNEDAKDTEDTLSSQTPEISSQNSADSPIAQTTGKNDSCLLSTSEEEQTAGVKPNWSTTSFVRLLEMTDNNEDRLDNSTVPGKTIASCSQSSLCHVPNSGAQSTEFDLYQKNSKFSDISSEKELCMAEISELSSESASGTTFQKSTAISFGVQKHPSPIACSSSNEQIEINQKKVDNQRGKAPGQDKMQGVSEKPTYQQNLMDATCSSNIDNSKNSEHKEVNSNKNGVDNHPGKTVNGPKSKGGRISKEKENQVDWDQLRKQTPFGGRKRKRDGQFPCIWKRCTHDKFSINDPDQWTNISFGNLLRAMGKKAAMENALTPDNFAKSSTSSLCFQPQFEDPLARTGFAADPSTISAPYFHSQVEGSQFEMSSGNSSQVGMPANTVTDRSSTPARHFPDLNSPPKIISDAILRRRTLCKFEAIIPEKANRGEYQQERAMKHSSIDKAAMGEKNEICRDGVMLLLEQKEESHLVSEQHPQRCTRGKCQLVFSDVTHDKEPNTFGHRQRHMSDSRKTDKKTTQRIKRRRSEGPTPGHSRTMAASP